MASANIPAMSMLCGPWGSKNCSAHRWFNYLGSTNNGYAPFDIHYQYITPKNVTKFKPMSYKTLACNEATQVKKILINFRIYSH